MKLRKCKKKPVEVNYLKYNDIVKIDLPNPSKNNPLEDLGEMVECVVAPLITHLNKLGNCKIISKQEGKHIKITIKTLRDEFILTPEEYLIIGTTHEMYPCKIDIFKETYDVIDDDEIAFIALGETLKAGYRD